MPQLDKQDKLFFGNLVKDGNEAAKDPSKRTVFLCGYAGAEKKKPPGLTSGSSEKLILHSVTSVGLDIAVSQDIGFFSQILDTSKVIRCNDSRQRTSTRSFSY
jgi:hypothetical protein